MVSNHFIRSLQCNTHTHTFLLSPQSSCIFTHPVISVGSIPPFQSVSYLFSFQLLLESINTLFLSYFLLPFMYVLVCRIFSVIFHHQIPIPFFSHLYPKPLKSSPILTISWLPGVDHLCHPVDFFVSTLLKLQSKDISNAFFFLGSCDAIIIGFFIFLIFPTLVLDFLISATVIVP